MNIRDFIRKLWDTEKYRPVQNCTLRKTPQQAFDDMQTELDPRDRWSSYKAFNNARAGITKANKAQMRAAMDHFGEDARALYDKDVMITELVHENARLTAENGKMRIVLSQARWYLLRIGYGCVLGITLVVCTCRIWAPSYELYVSHVRDASGRQVIELAKENARLTSMLHDLNPVVDELRGEVMELRRNAGIMGGE